MLHQFQKLQHTKCQQDVTNLWNSIMNSKEANVPTLLFPTKQLEEFQNQIETENSKFQEKVKSSDISDFLHLVPPLEYERTNASFLSSLGLPSITNANLIKELINADSFLQELKGKTYRFVYSFTIIFIDSEHLLQEQVSSCKFDETSSFFQRIYIWYWMAY